MASPAEAWGGRQRCCGRGWELSGQWLCPSAGLSPSRHTWCSSWTCVPLCSPLQLQLFCCCPCLTVMLHPFLKSSQPGWSPKTLCTWLLPPASICAAVMPCVWLSMSTSSCLLQGLHGLWIGQVAGTALGSETCCISCRLWCMPFGACHSVDVTESNWLYYSGCQPLHDSTCGLAPRS